MLTTFSYDGKMRCAAEEEVLVFDLGNLVFLPTRERTQNGAGNQNSTQQNKGFKYSTYMNGHVLPSLASRSSFEQICNRLVSGYVSLS